MEEKCSLCGKPKVYGIKSHYTPAKISENTFGERNRELIYTIDPGSQTIDTYYGPQNPQTDSTEIKEAPNSKKGIFCKECENNFGVYESVAQPAILELVNGIGHGVAISKTADGEKFVEIQVHPNILITFYQGVAWRQCIQQRDDGKDSPITKDDLERLRLLVLENHNTPIDKIVNKDLSSNPLMSILTTYNTRVPTTPSYVNPFQGYTNPVVFFVSSTVLLYWINENLSGDFEAKTAIPASLLATELTLDKARLAISPKVWKKLHEKSAKIAADQFVGGRS